LCLESGTRTAGTGFRRGREEGEHGIKTVEDLLKVGAMLIKLLAKEEKL
jgi:hypothetical protein